MLPASGPQAIISCSPPGDTRGLVSVSISVAQACPKLPAILDMYAWCGSLSLPCSFLFRQSARPSCHLGYVQCLVQCLALHRHYVNICWVWDYINIRAVMIWMLKTQKIATVCQASVLLLFFKASFLSKGMSSRIDLQRTYESFEKKEQKIPVCIYNELCVVLTLINQYNGNKTYVPSLLWKVCKHQE